MSDELILHHYDGSPFSEKVRLMLGCKGLAWRSVKIPVVMPKPDLLALTGGYRRTPVLQVGADVYCDTALIARVLEARAPSPTLFPAGAPLAVPLAQWADSTLFWTVIPYAMQPAGRAHVFQGVPPEQLKAFAADRAPFTAGMVRQTVADAAVALQAQLQALQGQLADGRSFLFGEAPSVADFAVAHGLWYLRRAGPVAEVMAPHAALLSWLDRMLAIGHGRPEPMAAAEALVLAAASEPAPASVQPGLGFEPGQRVTVAATDYGREASAGTLVGLSADEVVIARDDERAGRVHVHFPRAGFQIQPQESA